MRSLVFFVSGCFANAGDEAFENAFGELLRFAELRQIFLKIAIQIESCRRLKFGAQNHIAQMDGMWKHGVIPQFFESCSGIIVVHKFLPAKANADNESV